MNHNSQTPQIPFPSDLSPSDALFSFQDLLSSTPTPLESLEFPSEDFNFRLNIRESDKKSFPVPQEELESPGLVLKRNRLYTSYDIYGNELNFEKEVFNFEDENENEEFEDRFGFGGDAEDLDHEDKENKDPESNLITPLKKRHGRMNDLMRSSNYSRRSPLVDITPPVLKKKSSMNDNSGIGRVLMYTPQQEKGVKSQSQSIMKSFR